MRFDTTGLPNGDQNVLVLFADEGIFLPLVECPDGEVRIFVSVSFRDTDGSNVTRQIAYFPIQTYHGSVQIPAGEILRNSGMKNGFPLAEVTFTAYHDAADQAEVTLQALFNRQGSFNGGNLFRRFLTDRPKRSRTYPGAREVLHFLRRSDQSKQNIIATLHFSNRPERMLDLRTWAVPDSGGVAGVASLDVSPGTLERLTEGARLTGYELTIRDGERSGDTVAFEVIRPRSGIHSYKYLSSCGVYEYIHASGLFKRSLESSVIPFVAFGYEREQANESLRGYEQNVGHLDSAGQAEAWFSFLSAREHFSVEKDGSEREIVLDGNDGNPADGAVSDMTFSWHYSNRNSIVVHHFEVPLKSLAIDGPSTVHVPSNTVRMTILYTPGHTTQTGVMWNLVSGSAFASIDADTGVLTVKEGANGDNVLIRAVSLQNPSLSAMKLLMVIYHHIVDTPNPGIPVPDPPQVIPLTAITLSGPGTVGGTSNTAQYSAILAPSDTTQRNVTWSIVAGDPYASIDQTGKLTVKSGASDSSVTVRATSADNPAVFGQKTVTVTYNSGIGVTVSYPHTITSSAQRVQVTVSDPEQHGWRILERSGIMLGSVILDAGVISGNATVYNHGGEIDGTGDAVVYYEISANDDQSGRQLKTLLLSDQATGGSEYLYIAQQTAGEAFIPVTGLAISGPASVATESNRVRFKVSYTPSETSQTAVTWSIVSGSAYASINSFGLLTVKPGASGSSVVVKATSADNPSVYATKTVTVNYRTAVTYYALTVNTTPPDATVSVTAGGNARGYSSGMRIESGAQVSVTVSRAGYRSDTRTFTMDSDRTLNVSLQAGASTHSLTVNRTPSDALVSVKVDGSAVPYVSGMLVANGASVEVSVSKEGYVGQSQHITMDTDKTLEFTLVKKAVRYSLTVVCTPVDAYVTLDVSGSESNPEYSAGMLLDEGSRLIVTASKEGYFPSSREVEMTSDKTLYMNLEAPLQSLSISGEDSVADSSNSSPYSAILTPSFTTQRSVYWMIVKGSDYASIDPHTGVLTVKPGASDAHVVIRAASMENPSIVWDRIISVTYVGQISILPAWAEASSDLATRLDFHVSCAAGQEWSLDVLLPGQTGQTIAASVSPAEGTGPGDVAVYVKPNHSDSWRIYRIDLCTGGSVVQSAFIKQATDGILNQFTVSTDEVRFPYRASIGKNEHVVNVDAGMPWTADILFDADLRFAAQGDHNHSSEVTVDTTKDNMTGNSFSAVLRITAIDGRHKDVHLVQVPFIQLTSDYNTYGSTGGDGWLSVKAAVGQRWELSLPEWITTTNPQDRGGTGPKSRIPIVIASNPGTSDRSGLVMVGNKFSGRNGIVEITQYGTGHQGMSQAAGTLIWENGDMRLKTVYVEHDAAFNADLDETGQFDMDVIDDGTIPAVRINVWPTGPNASSKPIYGYIRLTDESGLLVTIYLVLNPTKPA